MTEPGRPTLRRPPAGLALMVLALLASPALAIDYHLHPVRGDDRNAGTSPAHPWKSLARVATVRLQPGDRVLLAAGEEFIGTLRLAGVAGSVAAPIVVTAFPQGDTARRPLLRAPGLRSAVHLVNSSHVRVSGLDLTADGPGEDGNRRGDLRAGLLVEMTRSGAYAGIAIDDLHVHDVFFEAPGFTRSAAETRSANGTQPYGFGIRVLSNASGATLSGLRITRNRVARVSHTGIKLGGGPGRGIRDVLIEDNRVTDTGGPGLQMSEVRDMVVRRNVVDGSGSTRDSRNWARGSGMWTWRSDNVLIEHNSFLNANGPGDSAGVHIDFGCSNVVIQHNLSANNAGGFCEILGEGSNNTYRYNVSVNDGHRVKGERGAFQEGKTFWLSGYAGHRAPRSGPFNSYFYNNTVVVDEGIVAKFAVSSTASGVLIANNLFVIRGRSEAVLDDQYKPDRAGRSRAANVVFRNNLYLRPDTWPAATGLSDSSPIIGDPGIRLVDPADLASFQPSNAALVRDAGIAIGRLPGDNVGLPGGLAVGTDILGNPVVGLPDLGAIEMAPPR